MKKWGVVVAVAVLVAVAACDTAQSAIGVGVEWEGNGIAPMMLLPIKLSSGLIIEPMLAFQRLDPKGYAVGGTEIVVGARIEKAMLASGTTPVFGGYALVDLTSPDVSTGTAPDSYTDFQFGVFLGGSASLCDQVDIVGSWGPTVMVNGKRFSGGDSWTDFSSRASITFRWWLWGTK
jgi:hypothetical protein